MQPTTQPTRPTTAIAQPDPDNLPLSRWQPPTSTPRRGTLLFLYGGSMEQDFRLKTAPLAKPLAEKLGFDVFVFDYRSNANGNNHLDFGMYDRIQDAKQMIEYMQKLGEPPFTLLGLSMGGHIAVRAAAETDPRLFENVILIAPAAYSCRATKPGVLFGAGEGRFKNIINETNSWKESDAFAAARKIDANCLLIRIRQDKVVESDITDKYRLSLGANYGREGSTQKPERRFVEIFTGAHQSLEDPARIDRLVLEIDVFLTTTRVPAATFASAK